MSLVPAFVKADDGRYYENPIIEGDDWFICWDDDDPVELVTTHPGQPQRLLEKLPFTIKGRNHDFGVLRNFKGQMKSARAYWLEQTGPIPVKRITKPCKSRADRNRQGVYYGDR